MLSYQVIPPLSDEEFAALKADIGQRGVLVPVEYDEDGNILDGHHRTRACEEQGVSFWPRVVRRGSRRSRSGSTGGRSTWRAGT